MSIPQTCLTDSRYCQNLIKELPMFKHRSVATRVFALLSLSILALGAAQADEARWWRGNTHTHSWWSDGDAPPARSVYSCGEDIEEVLARLVVVNAKREGE